MLSVADIRLQFIAARRAPIPYLLAAVIAAVIAWSIARTVDASSFTNEAAALKVCDEHVSALQDRLANSNRELGKFQNTLVTKIQAEAAKLPPSFVDTFAKQVSTGVDQIQKSNKTILDYTWGKSLKSPDTLMEKIPLVPNPSYTPKSGTSLPEMH